MKQQLIEKLQNINFDNNLKDIKNKQLIKLIQKLGLKKCEEYNGLIFIGHSPDKILPKLKFVETGKDEDLYDYYINVTSSIPQSKIPGRVLKILIYDELSKKYIGLLQLSIDLLLNDHKREFFNLDKNKYNRFKKRIRDNGANITVCVPLQPFGFNFCGGKLLAMLAFSKEVYQYYFQKYHVKLKYLITLSIHGKSIQYDRVKQLKFIGYTAGYGTGHLSKELIEMMKDYVKIIRPKHSIKKMSKCTIANIITQDLNLERNFLQHGKKRGIYIGVTGSKSIQYIKKEVCENEWKPDILKSIDDIYKYWLNRHAIKRKLHLIKTERFKY